MIQGTTLCEEFLSFSDHQGTQTNAAEKSDAGGTSQEVATNPRTHFNPHFTWLVSSNHSLKSSPPFILMGQRSLGSPHSLIFPAQFPSLNTIYLPGHKIPSCWPTSLSTQHIDRNKSSSPVLSLPQSKRHKFHGSHRQLKL